MADSFRIEVRGIEAVRRKFELLAKNAPDMAARIINYTGRDVRKVLQASILAKFDRPTPFTQRSVFSTSATPQKLYSEVGIKKLEPKTSVPGLGDNYHYLRVHQAGGTRPMKGSEYRLGGYWVPGAAAKLNQYGNISQGELQKIFAAIGGNLDAYTNTDLNRTRNTRRGLRPYQTRRRLYYFGRIGKKQTLGIWAIGENIKPGGTSRRSYKNRIRPVLIFPDQGRKAPRYSKRWPFFTIGRQEAAKSFPRNANFFFKAWVSGIK